MEKKGGQRGGGECQVNRKGNPAFYRTFDRQVENVSSFEAPNSVNVKVYTGEQQLRGGESPAKKKVSYIQNASSNSARRRNGEGKALWTEKKRFSHKKRVPRGLKWLSASPETGRRGPKLVSRYRGQGKGN